MTPGALLSFIHSPEGLAAARDFLSSALRMDALIGVKLARLDGMRSLRERVKAAPEEDEAFAAAEGEVLVEYHALLDRQRAIGGVIRRVPDERQRAILEMRYLQGLPFFRIAMALNYEERQIYRLHKEALRHVAALLAADSIS